MLSKCANPACNAPFQYLRDGKIYKFERWADEDAGACAATKPVRKVEHFWLCGRCAGAMTLKLQGEHEVVAVPHPRPAAIAS